MTLSRQKGTLLREAAKQVEGIEVDILVSDAQLYPVHTEEDREGMHKG